MDEFLTFAHELADAAGAVIRPFFGTELQVDLKADDSPVSNVDREAEAAIRALITQRFSSHGILGEEYGTLEHSSRITHPYLWIIDPIDGTRAFLAGKKEWGTLIALCEDGVPILGILDQPVTGERWVGGRGMATSYNGRAIRSRACSGLDNADISTTSRNHFTPTQARAFVALAETAANAIEDGDCYAYGMLAHGARDLVVDAGLKPYDILALVPILEGAGARITGWNGAPLSLTNFANVLASGDPQLHKVALAILNQSV